MTALWKGRTRTVTRRNSEKKNVLSRTYGRFLLLDAALLSFEFRRYYLYLFSILTISRKALRRGEVGHYKERTRTVTPRKIN
jgi:hypothetical protein